jgi:nicotinamidase-related amidase
VQRPLHHSRTSADHESSGGRRRTAFPLAISGPGEGTGAPCHCEPSRTAGIVPAATYDGAMPLIDRAESVLVVVDAQPGFFAKEEPERSVALDVVERARWLASVARLLDIPAVVTEEAPEREGATEPRLLECLPAGVPVLTKPSFGLADCPDIVHEILQTKRSTAVLVGFETDVCVLQSAVGLKDMGFRVVVVADASYTQDALQHEFGLRRMAQLGVEVAHAKGVAFEWMRTVDVAIETTRAVSASRLPEPRP